MTDKLQDCMVERPKLFVTGIPSYLFIVSKAMELAKQHGMDHKTIVEEAMAAGPAKGKEVLGKYFEVI